MTTLALRPADFLDGFTVPPAQEATRPAETRGIRRDHVRLMTTSPEGIGHHVFTDLPGLLRSGDLVVFNDSATLPAAVMVDRDLVIHFSTRLPGGLHVVEPRRPTGATSLPYGGIEAGRVDLPGGASLELLTPYPVGSIYERLWVARSDLPVPRAEYLATWGRPIRYRHTDGPYKIDAYQTVFARVPGSAEMPSAGRPFTERLVAELSMSGVTVAPLTLHTGVSSQETGEPPYSEWFEIPERTADLVNHTRASGGRVIAVGTTVVRALETTVDSRSVSHPGRSWTDLVIELGHDPRAVDGLITGWHEPESSHLGLLEAFAGRTALAQSYEAALACGYLWHEFGDSHLILAI
jgi:S-adenosylmethionine:tRNA ribosyltransferase-isomerase